MRQLMLIALAAFAASGCQKTINTPHGPREFHYEVRETSNPVGRFYMIHGFGVSISSLKQAPYKTVADKMHDLGFEVVYLGWDAIDNSDTGNGGADYIAKWKTYVTNIDQWRQSVKPVSRVWAWGMSMGAPHAVWLTDVVATEVLQVHEPVTKVSVLTSRFPLGTDTTAMDLQNHVRPNVNKFWITVGLLDTSVDWTLTKQLYGSELYYVEIPNRIHESVQPDFDLMADWLEQQY